MTAPTRKRSVALLAAGLLAGLLALPLIAAAPAAAQARDISNACQGAPQSDFPDRGNAAQAAAIDCIAAYGITAGKADGTYGTGDPVQRDQMATFLVREMLLVPNNNLPAAPAQNQFPCDVSPTNAAGQPNPHYENIQRLSATRNPRIAQGGPGGRPADCYGPTMAVTRGQMASFIVRHLQFLGVTLPTNPPDAFDDDNGNTHEENIDIVAALGIAQGTSERRFQPNAATTRGQMAFFLSRDLSVLVEAGKVTRSFRRGVTNQPELIAASVVSTSANGTGVRFTFDQDLTTATVTSSRFFVHQADNARFAGSTGSVESGGRAVLINFPGVSTSSAAQNLTLGTVDDGAVTYTNGVTNPEGDAPIGAQTTTPDVQPGVTTAPDLIRVDNVRPSSTPGTMAVDFHFDQRAFRTTGTPGGFALVFTDGSRTTCEGPDSGDDTAGGGNSAGGEGTNRFTVICDNPPSPVPGVPLPGFQLSDVARGIAMRGAVASTAGQVQSVGAANQNPLQASDNPDVESDDGNRPDLVSATFTAGTGGARDSVIYTFDQPVATGVGAANLFAVYLNDGTEVPATAPSAGDAPAINPANTRQVRATFPAGTLTNAVGANVRAGAVTERGDDGAANHEDEEGASLGTSTTRTPGVTTGPNLTAVALSRPNDPFGNPGDYVATYTFDEAVTLQNAGQAGAPTSAAGETRFYLFTSGGSRLTSTDCTVGTGANTNRVTCTAYDVGGSDATPDQIGSTVLGTVDFAAVFGAGGAQTNQGDRNPEGARATSGGTGTPA